jgi:hypothetical protein
MARLVFPVETGAEERPTVRCEYPKGAGLAMEWNVDVSSRKILGF